MSWSDDIRCLYCDGRLPLYRKITHGQFCSSAHRKAYWKEQERLAVERLTQTHNSLRIVSVPEPVIVQPMEAARPEIPDWLRTIEPVVVEQLPGPPALEAAVEVSEPVVPPMAAVLRSGLWFQGRSTAPGLILSDPIEFESEPVLLWPATPVVPVATECFPPTGPVRMPRRKRSKLRKSSALLGADFERTEEVPELIYPSQITAPGGGLAQAGKLPLAWFEVRQPVETPAAIEPVVLEIPVRKDLHGVCVAGPLDQWLDTLPQPGRVAMPEMVLRDQSFARHFTAEPYELRAADAVLPAAAYELPSGLDAVGKVPLPASEPRVWQQTRELEVRESGWNTPDEIERPRLAAVAGSTSMPVAGGSRYPVNARTMEGTVMVFRPVPLPGLRRPMELPRMRAQVVGVDPQDLRIPPMARLQALPVVFQGPKKAAAKVAEILVLPQPANPARMLPRLRVEPVAVRTLPDFVPDAAKTGPIADSSPQDIREMPVQAPTAAWKHALGFAKYAPRDLKILLLVLPALIALAFYPSLPKVKVSSTPATSGFTQMVSNSWSNVRQTMMDRAAVALDEDFRRGLDDWTGRDQGPAEWSYDATGFVKPGRLALYAPAMPLRDYQMQFLGMIDKKAMSWVVRANDFENYYVVKLVVLKPGPIPLMGVTRYAVVGGKAVDRKDVPLPMDAREDTLYRVKMDVRGDDYTLWVQGQLIDHWSEKRLRQGGIGFFSARGEESRVRWVQLTHQYDMLGRLCAYLAPYNFPTTNGSFQQ